MNIGIYVLMALVALALVVVKENHRYHSSE